MLVKKPDRENETEHSEIKHRHADVQIISMVLISYEKIFPVEIIKFVMLPTPNELKRMRQIKQQNLKHPLRIDTKVINTKSHRSHGIHTSYQNEFFRNLRNTRFLWDGLDALESHNGLVICLEQPWKRNHLPNRNRGKDF